MNLFCMNFLNKGKQDRRVGDEENKKFFSQSAYGPP